MELVGEERPEKTELTGGEQTRKWIHFSLCQVI
jgi:hypothetical protein